jgi:signal transduction histidine kinase
VWEGHELHLQEAGFSTRWDAAPPPYPVTGDEDALAQVLVNLLSNAEKYSGDKKEVTLQSYLDSGRVCVGVLDRGAGVPPGEEAKIFEPFYRANDSLSSGVQGAGLGLTLAQHVVREHKGDILYQARPGGGSIFTMRLPLRTDSIDT